MIYNQVERLGAKETIYQAFTPKRSFEVPQAKLADWEQLEKTGFNPWNELARAAFNLYFYQSSLTPAKALERAIKEVRGNIYGVFWEYIQKNKVIYNPIWLGAVDGEGVDVRSKYGDRPLRQTIGWRERLGAVALATTQAADFMINAPDGSIAVIASPLGETGLSYPPRYEFSQLSVWIKQGGELEAFTFVNKMSGQENKTLLERLGVEGIPEREGRSELEWLAEIVKRPALIRGDIKRYDFSEIATLMREVRLAKIHDKQSKWVQVAEIEEEYKEIIRNLKRKDQLKRVNHLCEELIDKLEEEFKNYLPTLIPFFQKLGITKLDEDNREVVKSLLSSNPKAQYLIKKLSQTVLDIYSIINGDEAQKGPILGQRTLSSNKYQFYYTQFKQVAGCNGGGREWSFSSSYLFSHEWHLGICQICAKKGNLEVKLVGPCRICKSCELQSQRLPN